MPARPFLPPVLLVLTLAGAAPAVAQRLGTPRFPAPYAARIFVAGRVAVDSGVAADSADAAEGAFIGAVIASGFGSVIGIGTGVLTVVALGINGEDHPVATLAIVLPQSALAAGAAGCAVYHASASCRPIFVASALGAAGGALLVSLLPYASSGWAVAFSYLGVHTLAIAVAGAAARHAAATSSKASP